MKFRRHWKKIKTKIRALALPGLHRFAAPLIKLRRSFFPPAVALDCIESTSPGNPPLSILCSLTGPVRHFFLELAFGEASRAAVLGQFPLPKIFRTPCALKADASLIVIETKPTHHAWLDDGTWFFIPNWVSGEIELPIPANFMRSESVKSDLRNLRKHSYEYEVTRDETKLRDFYDNMHLPYIGRVHGNEAVLDSFEEKLNRAEECDLLLVKKNGVAVAGILIVYEAVPRLWSLGVRDGDMVLARQGVTPALYHFAAEYLRQKGHSKMHLGSSRPFPNNGLLKFKRKMSQTLTGNSWPGFALKILKLDDAAKKFLQSNPFIFCAPDGLRAAVFTGEELHAETFARIEKDFFQPGLKKLIIYSFREIHAAGITPPAAHIEIRSAHDLIAARKPAATFA